jgi:hypothetical protein
LGDAGGDNRQYCSKGNALTQADPASNGKKCGDPGNANRLFDLRGGEATESACKEDCDGNTDCVAMSGMFSQWCIGCSVPLTTSHAGAMGFVKQQVPTAAPTAARTAEPTTLQSHCQTMLAKPAPRGTSMIEVDNTGGCTPNKHLLLGNGALEEAVEVLVVIGNNGVVVLKAPLEKKHEAKTKVEGGQVCRTSLAKPAAPGESRLEVTDVAGCKEGDVLELDDNPETVSLKSIVPARHDNASSGGEAHIPGSFELVSPLKKKHLDGLPVGKKAVCNTQLATACSPGAGQIEVVDATSCGAGTLMKVGSAPADEIVRVKNVHEHTLMLDTPLGRKHNASEEVSETQECKTTLKKRAGVGDKKIEVVDSGGCSEGELLVLDGKEPGSYEAALPVSIDAQIITLKSPLHKEHEAEASVEARTASTMLAKKAAGGAARIEVVDAIGIRVGDHLRVDKEVVRVQAKSIQKNVLELGRLLIKSHEEGAPVELAEQVCKTELAKPATRGDKTIHVADSSGCEAGDLLRITDSERVADSQVKVESVEGSRINLVQPLKRNLNEDSTVEEKQMCKSELASDTEAGDFQISVVDVSGCVAGDYVSIAGKETEISQIASANPATNTIMLLTSLVKKHQAKAVVEETQICSTFLTSASAPLAKELLVSDIAGCEAGDWVVIDDRTSRKETVSIDTIVMLIDREGSTLPVPQPSIRLSQVLRKPHQVNAKLRETQEPEKFDCFETGKKDYCCKHYGKMCVSDDLYDCDSVASPSKSKWCCRNENLGC